MLHVCSRVQFSHKATEDEIMLNVVNSFYLLILLVHENRLMSITIDGWFLSFHSSRRNWNSKGNLNVKLVFSVACDFLIISDFIRLIS